MPDTDKRPAGYTPQQEETIRLFRAWYTSQAIPRDRAAAKIECAESTLCQIELGNYAGRSDTYIAKMARFLDRLKRAESATKPPNFVLTSVAEKIDGLCTLCLDGRRMGLAEIPSGVGKTQAAQAYAAAHPDDCRYIECSPKHTAMGILYDVADAIRVGKSGTRHLLFRNVVDQLVLRGQPLLIFDDVDNLTRDALYTIRQLHDQAKVGIVLLGTEDFLTKLRRRPTGLDQQALNRILHLVNLHGINQDDAEKLTSFFELPTAARLLAWQACDGDARRLVHGCIDALDRAAAYGEPVCERHIERAFAALRQTRLAV
jgi:DNA transposition AAA+ family ATPase